MVTKPLRYRPSLLEGFILAKIHMVTKPQKDDTTRILFDKVLINLFH